METGTDHLLADLSKGVLTLTLNRPEARNAMSGPMVDALSNMLSEAELNREVRCVILTGAGKGFCAGGDIKGMAPSKDDSVDDIIARQRHEHHITAQKLYNLAKPTIAALPGAAAGAGMSWALACDMRIMANTAMMTTAFANVGFSGDHGGTYFLSQLVGAAKARELYYFSNRVGAEEALKLGLTNWVCGPEELMNKTREMAEQLAAGPAVAYRYMKENFNRALASGDLKDCLDIEATHHIHCSQTEDHREAIQAFVEKRTPVFKGR
ncbi:enoyl-CoA hydratase [Oceaniserpentilla sp. 4NH20-0058]|uniref:enoyl-CoA hydratase n=1 Tax=Oceaniserpentilla sp. 4NH20-0058 TaxID=3127660 RepID=UPI00310BBD5D